MTQPIVPECTGNPKDCLMCSMIRNIFEGFPKEKDPGCELRNNEKESPDAGGNRV